MPIADDEARRIDVLRTYGVLDTAPEAAYDQITELAASLCGVPIAFVSLVDAGRLWFKSVFGIDWRATPRDMAFCAHTIGQPELFIVEDAAADARFAASPLVCSELGMRFYAGVPLVNASGVALGALAVLDRQPRTLAPLQRQALRALGGQVMTHLEAHRRQRTLEDALVDRERGQAALRDSETRWRLLFERNPLPMWIFDIETLRFLAVNDAAALHYGWSPSEFAAMTILDIRPEEELPALMDDLAQRHTALRGGQVWRHRKKSGEIIHVDITAHSVQFEGRAARLVLAHDITDRVRASQAVRASDARWARLFKASATGIASAAMDGGFDSVNPAFCELLGRSEAELLGRQALDFTHPDDLGACQAELQRLAAGAIDSFTIDKRYLRPDGRAVWARTAVTTTSGDGESRQLVAVVQDIDAQHHAAEELKRQHTVLAIAGRLAGLGGWEIRLPGHEVRWTPELLAILDIPPGHWPTVEEAVSWYVPESRVRMSAALEACLRDGTPFDMDMEIVTPAGRALSVRGIGVATRDAAGRLTGACGALIDQTERQRVQRGLAASEERFRNVARATADAVWDWDLVTDRLWWSEGVQTLFGHDRAALEPGIASWTRRIHADDLASVQSNVDATIDRGGERWSAEYRFARADGSFATVLDRGFVMRDAAGRAVRMVGGMTDLSAQRQAEQRLRQQAALLDAARDAILVRDLDDRIVYWNQGAERLFGWPAAEAVGQAVSALLKADEVAAAGARDDVLARGEWAGVVACRRQDGRPLMVDVRLTLLRDPAGQPEAVLAIKTDVTERVAMEAQLQQALRLEAVGQLTGGVAHDFNNLLTVIQGNTELLAEQLAGNPLLLPLAQMASTAAQRGAELTQRLLAFARKQPLQPQPVDAHQLLAGMDGLLRRTLPEDIELELVRAAGLWPLLADPVQLESAVLNLVLNARDAMPNGGKITLETANAWVDEHYAERHTDVQPGQYVLLSVSDTGTGMTAAALARAFEPFFTTKGVGKGTGLGLSMVYGFAKQSRGHAKLYSEPGHGTTARLYLPRADHAATTTAPGPRADGELRGSATVLVVEDDELVRRFATDLLRGLGYRVLAAEHGAAALALLRERSDVELLFTDVVMPGGLNGRQLADAALALHPKLKVLFTSGYTENAIVHHGRLDRGVHLLAKPYRVIDLARKVRAVLG